MICAIRPLIVLYVFVYLCNIDDVLCTNLNKVLFCSVFSGSSIWNSIPNFIHNSSNHNIFKVRYLKWYQSSG